MNEAEYFKDRGMNQWHYLQTNIWVDHFKPKRVLDVGCGLGNLVKAFEYLGIEAFGCDISIFAVDNGHKEIRDRLRVGDVRAIPFGEKFADLVICYDVLEHVNEDEAIKSIKELKRVSSKWILCSICMQGDPNFPLDPTHKLMKTRSWWEHKFKEAGLKVHEVPKEFLFSKQLVIAEVVE